MSHEPDVIAAEIRMAQRERAALERRVKAGEYEQGTALVALDQVLLSLRTEYEAATGEDPKHRVAELVAADVYAARTELAALSEQASKTDNNHPLHRQHHAAHVRVDGLREEYRNTLGYGPDTQLHF